MVKLTLNGLLYYGGIVLMGTALLLFVFGRWFFRKREEKLKKTLDQEYGAWSE